MFFSATRQAQRRAIIVAVSLVVAGMALPHLQAGTADHVIPPAQQAFMSKRANAHIVEINAPHLSMISDPGAVTDIILKAAVWTAQTVRAGTGTAV
jgi:pimeloyl-ACP methyl ester carboxylesterase